MTDTPLTIFLDGVDGVGKTTLVNALSFALQEDQKRDVVVFRLPETCDRADYRGIIKSGPRLSDDPILMAHYDLEDAFLNMACFVDLKRRIYEYRLAFPNGVVICDRSLESIWCYQRHVADYSEIRNMVYSAKADLLGLIPQSFTFILSPPKAFIVNNLKASGRHGDVLDQEILQDVEKHKLSYLSPAINTTKKVLANPDTYLEDILRYIR